MRLPASAVELYRGLATGRPTPNLAMSLNNLAAFVGGGEALVAACEVVGL